MSSSAPQSTLLENLQLGGEGASLQLDGQPVELRGDAGDPTVGAFQAFYFGALEDYRLRRPARRPGLFQRMRSWLARLLGGAAAPAARPALPPDVFSAAVPVRSPALPGPPRRTPEPARVEKPANRPAPESKPELPAATAPARRGEGPPVPPPTPGPRLRSAYADRAGVHLLWQPEPGCAAEEKIELIYDLDSAVAQRLQECYGQLSKRGYKVVGLELLRPEAAAPSARAAVDPAAPEASVPAPGASESRIAAKSAEGAEAARPAPAEKKERTLVMRLHPAAPDEPHRALVAPVDNQENLQALVAPERLVRALYAAADPAQPPERRVTYLRCALGKSGLKVVDVGTGEGREQGPARWEEIAAWWEAAQKSPDPAAKKVRPPAIAGPAPELGLF